MPGTMTDIQTVTASFVEVDADNEPVAVDQTTIQWTVGDPTFVTVTVSAAGAAFAFNTSFAGTLPNTTSVAGTDPASGLSAQDTLTVTASAATTASIAFGTPTP